MTKTATAIALAALAHPALATTVYVPFADRLEAGAPQHRTELRLTNTQPSLAQSVSYRVYVDGKASVVKTIQLGPGQSRTVAPAVAAGSAGLIEIDAPGAVAISGRLLVERPGNTARTLSMPAFTAESAAPAGVRIVLQGLSNGDKSSSLSIQNFDAKSATCTLGFEDADGKALGTEIEFSLPGKSSRHIENALATLGSSAIADATARISCDRTFWSYATVEDLASADTELVTPARELSAVSAPMTSATGALTSPIVFTLNGTYLVSSNTNLNWVYKMPMGATYTFRKAIVDYDVLVKNWDPNKTGGFHELLWLQKGTKWTPNMMIYINSQGSKGKMRYEANYNLYTRLSHTPGIRQQTGYHMHYEWDGILRKSWYQMNLLGTTTKATGYSVGTGAGNFSTAAPFIGMGGQTSCLGCPESKEPGWTYSNLRVQWVP